jgi:hypothetical protein
MNSMTFLVLKRSVILAILLFDAASEAAVRGQWNAEHDTIHTTNHHETEVSSRYGDQRQLGSILPEGDQQREWTDLQSFPRFYHHGHHHHESFTNQRKMKSENENMGKKTGTNTPMFVMNTMAPNTTPTSRKPTKHVPTSKLTNMQMGKKGISQMEMGTMNMKTSAPITSAPINESPATNPPAEEQPTVEQSPVNVPTGDDLSPTEDGSNPIADIRAGYVPTEDSPTADAPTVEIPTVDAPSADAPTADTPTADNEPVSIGSRNSDNQQIDNLPMLRDFQNRIIGGTPAGINEFKFFASLSIGCGGSLIAPGIVLTAAHCAGNILTARIGSNVVNSGGVVKNVMTQCVHPNYDPMTVANDYMLLKLDSPVDINQYPLIQLNNNKAVPQTNQILTVIGFGATSEGGFGSNTLLKVNVPANSHQQCNQQYGGGIVESVMFCAGMISGGKDSCQGDSGGPIFEVRGGKVIQVGVVSFGEGCARPNRSGVYSRVSGAYDWIQTTMAKLNNGDTSGCRGGTPSPPSRPPVKVPTKIPVKSPTKTPVRTKSPTQSPTTKPVAPVRPPSPPIFSFDDDSITGGGDDAISGSDDDSIWNDWSRRRFKV